MLFRLAQENQLLMIKNVAFVFLILFSFFALAQNKYDDSKQYVVVKNDKSEYRGEIISSNSREVLIKTNNLGQVYIPRHEIKEIRVLDDDLDDSWSNESKVTLIAIFIISTLIMVLRTFRNKPQA